MPARLQFARDKNQIGTLTFTRTDQEQHVIDRPFLEDLQSYLSEITKDTDLKGLILQSSSADFCAGYLTEELQQVSSAEEGQQLSRTLNQICNQISRLKIPTVCLIHGACLGPGLELALACNRSLVSDSPSTRLGFPEIHLGLIPGGGGTRRLPAKIGLQAAVDMILTGREISAKKAVKIGLVDACVPLTLLTEQGFYYVLKGQRAQRPAIISTGPAHLGRDLPKWAIEGNPIGRMVMFRKVRDLVDEKTKGFCPASYKAIEALFDGYELSDNERIEHEAALFGELIRTRQSQSLMHLFSSRMRARHKARAGADNVQLLPFRQKDSPLPLVGIVGAGLMGTGIAVAFAKKDISVRISDESEEAMSRALQHAHNYFIRQVDRRSLKPFEMQRKMARISPALDMEGIQGADLVIEAVREDPDIKQAIAREVTHKGHPRLIWASNTSALSVARIAGHARYPGQVVGMHFFSPVEKMPLMELVVTDKTEPWVIDQCLRIGSLIDKVAIIVKDSPGFYTTRTLAVYLSEAISLLASGTSPEAVDHALTQFGFSQGPISLMDDAGLDVCIPVLNTISGSFPDKMSLPESLGDLYESGRLGRKNGGGFYLYKEGEKAGTSRDVLRLLRAGSAEDVQLPADEITERCLMLFVNESVACLEEGVLGSPEDGDLGAVYGLGFPPFWGGAFKYIDFVGAHHVVEVLSRLSDKYGPRFRPAQMLVEYSRKNKKFFPDEPWQYARH